MLFVTNPFFYVKNIQIDVSFIKKESKTIHEGVIAESDEMVGIYIDLQQFIFLHLDGFLHHFIQQ